MGSQPDSGTHDEKRKR